MTKTILTAGALTGLLIAGTVSAQSVAATTGVTAQQAIEIALTAIPGEVTEVEREREDGMTVFEVEILTAEGARYEIDINAETGEILKTELEDDDDGRGDTD